MRGRALATSIGVVPLMMLVLVMSVPAAQASSINVHIGAEMGGTAVIHAPGTLGDGLNVYVGASAVSGDLGIFETYCVDLQHYAALPGDFVVDPLDRMTNWNINTSPGSIPDAVRGAEAAWLYNTNWQAAASAGNVARAGLQLAIWDVLWGDGLSVDTPNTGFWVDPSTTGVTGANGYLTALGHQSGPLGDATWLRTTDSGQYTQDFIGPTVPEPSSMVLLGSALVGLARLLRRLRSKAA